jgi:hypothetical protein
VQYGSPELKVAKVARTISYKVEVIKASLADSKGDSDRLPIRLDLAGDDAPDEIVDGDLAGLARLDMAR